LTRVSLPLDEARRIYPPIWVVYANPADFPGEWVARTWYGEVASAEVIRAGDLVTLRDRLVRAGASIQLARHADDDPVIREAWI